MIAFHGRQDLKARYLARVECYRRLGRLVRGTGWRDAQGCAVGCTLEAYDHSQYPLQLGIPAVLAHLEDVLFETLSEPDALELPQVFLRSVPVGADLSGVWSRFVVWLLTDSRHGLLRIAEPEERHYVHRVADLFRFGVPEESVCWRDVAQARPVTIAMGAAWAAASSVVRSESCAVTFSELGAEVTDPCTQAGKLISLLEMAPIPPPSAERMAIGH